MYTCMGGKTTKFTLQHKMINKKTNEKKKNQNKKGRKTKVRREFFFRTYL